MSHLLLSEDQVEDQVEVEVLKDAVMVSSAVGRLGKELSCRYHFASSAKESFVLPPYCNNIGVSRFYGIEPPNSIGKVTINIYIFLSLSSQYTQYLNIYTDIYLYISAYIYIL